MRTLTQSIPGMAGNKPLDASRKLLANPLPELRRSLLASATQFEAPLDALVDAALAPSPKEKELAAARKELAAARAQMDAALMRMDEAL